MENIFMCGGAVISGHVCVAVTEFLVKQLPKNESHGEHMYMSGM